MILKRALACLLLLLLAGCSKNNEPDELQKIQQHYAGLDDWTADADITVTSGMHIDYTVSYTRAEGVSTVTLLAPAELAGIQAQLTPDRTQIVYDDVAVETLLPPLSGYLPVDSIDGLLHDLAGEIPLDYRKEKADGKSLLVLSYGKDTEEFSGEKQVWLSAEDYSLQRAEFFLNGQMMMSLHMKTE